MQDVVIVGAGHMGLMLAIYLAKQQINTVVLDNHHLSEHNPHFLDIRVNAITPASQQILDAIGIWQNIAPNAICTFEKMTVWDAQNTVIHFNAKPALGYNVENRALYQALLHAAKENEFIQLHEQTPLNTFHAEENHITINSKITAKLLVGADGAHSRVRELANIPLIDWDYGHTALIVKIETKQSHENTAWQRFLPEGPLAFLPCANPHQCLIVWSHPPEKITALLKLKDDEFCHELSQCFQHQFGQLKLLSSRASYPLKMRHAKHYVKPRIALIGDAIHTIHPLAGQGMNLGIQDVATLAKTIMIAHQEKRDIGNLYTLRRFERARKGDNMAMIAAMDALKFIYTKQLLPLRLLRHAGIKLFNQQKLLKSFLMKYAMGIE